MNRNILISFKELKIDKNTLTKCLGKNPVHLRTDNPVPINCGDVKMLIDHYVTGKINYQTVIDWCDVVRFSDLFDYPDDENEQEVIARVIDEIQDIEDSDKKLSESQVLMWLELLKTARQ